MTVTVAGAGMAGLVAAARLRELGVTPTVREKGDRPGGSMVLSSGVIWRHHTLAEFRAECPGGDADLQALVVEQLDERLDWLESLGATVTQRETVNPLTTGRRFAPDALVAALSRAAGDVRLGEPLEELGDEPVVLATGGFGAALARQARRCRCGRARGARATASPSRASVVRPRRAGWTSSSGVSSLRAPARVGEGDFVRLAQLYGRHALVMDETGSPIESASCAWHENDLVQEIARRPAGRAWFLVAEETLDLAAGDATVRERIEAAREAGGTVVGAGRSAVRGAVRLPAGRARHGLGHAHDRRHRRRPRRPECSMTTARRSTASTRRASTSAASRPAATRAVSRPRSSSAASPRSR